MDEIEALSAGEPVPIDELQHQALTRLNAARQKPYLDIQADTQNRNEYYAGINLDGDATTLRTSLTQLLSTTHQPRLPYAPTEQLYPWVDLHPDGHLQNVYSGVRVDPETVIRDDARIARARADRLMTFVRSRPAAGALELHAAALEVEHTLQFNCEHVVPQSWFGRSEPMRGDLHHLFTCEPRCNSKRGNIPYAELTDDGTPNDECGRVQGTTGFEPFAGKGPVARATLYFLLRYPGVIGDRSVELQGTALAILLSWHTNDSASSYEQHRNAAIYEAQGNRNPFIDFAELTTLIDLNTNFSAPSDKPAPIESPQAT